jgi:2-succinyl-5-enolpyruvyl-6-hydroxy-3-cyclohexene-1-carboxylate synthase
MSAPGPADADVQAAFCATVVDEWVRGGVTDAVVSPGSRSTPLLLALSADARIRVHVVLDERSAGFFALGLGLRSGRPAVVVTTSGTAAVELHPAVVEAYQAGVPLVAVTADRPPELHDVGAPQTVDQERLYAPALRWRVSPGPPSLSSVGSWRSMASRSVIVARGETGATRPGPVHLNLAFREPLLGDPAGLVPDGRGDGRSWHRRVAATTSGQGPAAETVLGAAGRRGVIVAGGDAGDADALVAMAKALGWPLFADPRSGCRVPDPVVVGAADALLRTPEAAGWRPDVVLRLGQPWASKVLGQWLSTLATTAEQFLVDPGGAWADPDRLSAQVLAVDPTALAVAVAEQAGALAAPEGGWLRRWQAAERAAQAAIDATIAGEVGVTEAGLARTLLREAPDGTTLVVSSSMPVRDVEWYGPARHGVRVLSNRGANGIDGVVSTALGVAAASAPAPTVALVGDLAFLYDAGALLWARSREINLTVLVVDNDGGGIFSFLPQAAAVGEASFERLWATPHGLDLASVAAAYGVEVGVLDDLDALSAILATPSSPLGVRVIVARTSRAANVAAHDRIHAAVARALSTIG